MILFQINKLTTTLSLIACLILTTAIYSPGLSGDFIFDDFPNIVLNQNIKINSLNFDALYSASMSSNAGILKRPVSMLSFALNHYFFGIKPFSFKIANLIIHLLTGIGIFLLTRLILQRTNFLRQQEFSKQTLFFLPLIICLAWLIHPLNLTSVLYIVQRMTSLATLFTVFGIYVYILGRKRQLEQNKKFWPIPIGVILFGSLAALSKESGVLLPLYLLLVEIILFRFKNEHQKTDYKVVSLFALILFIPTVLVIGSLIFNPKFLIGGYNYRDFTLTERLMTEARVLIFYLKMIVMPTISELGIFHDDIPVSTGLLNPTSTLPSIIAVLSMIVIAISTLRKLPLFSFGILWFFIGHTLESTIIPLEITHEHRNYLADYGIIFCIFYLLAITPIIKKNLLLRYACAFMVIGLLSTVTGLRAHQWSDNILHAIYEAEHHPNSSRAVFSAGRIYTNLAIYTNADKSEDAFKMLERSRQLNKKDILPEISLIMLSYKLGKPLQSIWLEEAKRKMSTLPIGPSSILSLKELAKCQRHDCKLNNKDIDSLFQSSLNNTSIPVHQRRNPDLISAFAYHVLNNNKNYTHGYALFKEAIAISPNNIQYRVNIIGLLLIMREYNEARAHLNFIKKNNTLGRYNEIIQSIETDLGTKTTKKDD